MANAPGERGPGGLGIKVGLRIWAKHKHTRAREIGSRKWTYITRRVIPHWGIAIADSDIILTCPLLRHDGRMTMVDRQIILTGLSSTVLADSPGRPGECVRQVRIKIVQ